MSFAVFPRLEFVDEQPDAYPLKHRAAADPQERKAFGTAPLFGVLMASENRAEVFVGDTVSISKYLSA